MNFIWFLIVGFVAGLLARAIVPGKDSMGIIGTLVLGVVGSLVGGALANAIFNDTAVGLIGSTIGAILVLLAYNAITKRSGKGATA